MKYTHSTQNRDKEVVSVQFTEEGTDATIRTPEGRTIIELGIGKREEMTRRKLISIIRRVVGAVRATGKKKFALRFMDLVFPGLHMTPTELGEMIAVNLEMANFEFLKYKTKPKEGWSTLTEVIVLGKVGSEVERAIRKGKVIGEGVNATRTLANTPGGDMTPSKLAEAAVEAAEGLPIDITVLDELDMEALGMGAILGVGKGSEERPRFIEMKYLGGELTEAPIVLVGKGITFDSGGLNLKPTEGIYEMHMDMSGGAAVINAVVLAARLKLKKNIIALVPAAENMPSGSSYHPGDVLRSMSGGTIEVLNTDAEGRVVLADALHYAKQFTPRLVVDVATLTGAAMVALGSRASAIFTKDEELEGTLRKMGEETGDYVWPLPLWDEYEADIKGTFGDWANTGKGRMGGAITGAMFLYQFTKNNDGEAAYPWVHIDIAPRMTSGDGDYLAKGAAGEPVRLLVRLIERL